MQLDANNEVIDSDIMYFASTRLCHSAYLSTCFVLLFFCQNEESQVQMFALPTLFHVFQTPSSTGTFLFSKLKKKEIYDLHFCSDYALYTPVEEWFMINFY